MLITKSINYLGIEKLDTTLQVKVEIAGLRQLIKTAEEMICRLEQTLAIVELKKEETLEIRKEVCETKE